LAGLVLQRLWQGVATLFLLSLAVFTLGRMSGNPVDILLPIDANEAQREALVLRLGLDQPLLVQFGNFVRDALAGDFGTSIRYGVPALDIALERLPNSLRLVAVAIAISLLLGTVIGVSSAVRTGTSLDRFGTLFALLGQSFPAFFTGIVFMLIFGVWLGLLPVQGLDSWKSYLMPAFTMSWASTAGVTRLTRSSTLDVLGSEYIKMARSAGVSEAQVIWRDALKNAFVPALNYVGLSFGVLVGAAVATEVVFGIPGLARLAYEAAVWRDFPVLQTVVVIWAVIVVAVNLLVDVLHGVLDPRVRR